MLPGLSVCQFDGYYLMSNILVICHGIHWVEQRVFPRWYVGQFNGYCVLSNVVVLCHGIHGKSRECFLGGPSANFMDIFYCLMSWSYVMYP